MRSNTVFDTRAFDQRAEQALVLSLFEGLKEGESFEVRSERDPEDLCRQLEALQSPHLNWEFLEKSPRQWRLRIEKLSAKEAGHKGQGGCCGMCGG